MKLKKYNEFLNEAVYLGLKGLKDYNITSVRPGIRKNDFGHAVMRLIHFDDKTTDLLIETYGMPKDKELIVKIYSSSYEINEDRFKTVVEKLIYILNKNQLGEYFKIDSIKYDKDLESYAVLKTDSIVPIDKLEQLIMSTKITNSKIKDNGDLDKMIYQTQNESNYDLSDQTVKSIIDMYDISIGNDHYLKMINRKSFYKSSSHKHSTVVIYVTTAKGMFTILNVNNDTIDSIIVDDDSNEITSQDTINYIYKSLLLYLRFSKLNTQKIDSSFPKYIELTEDYAKGITGDIEKAKILFDDVYKNDNINVKWDMFSDEFIKTLDTKDRNLLSSTKSINKYNL